MKNLIFSTLLLTTIEVQATEKPTLRTITIDVAEKKANGKSWDMFGGSPDIKVVIDKQPYYSLAKCRDTYRCTISFTSQKDKWYIEVYDKDLQNDDLIGKGECEEGERCSLGLAKVEISD